MPSTEQTAAVAAVPQRAGTAGAAIPSYMRSAQTVAQRHGSQCTPLDVLAEDKRRMLESAYPGPDCLLPDEIEALVLTNDSTPERLAHIDNCPMCQEILALAAAEQSVMIATAAATP